MPVKKLGTASVDVEADVKPFGTDLAAKLKAAMSEGDREAKAAGKRLGKNIVDGIGDEIIRRTPALRRRINLMLRGISVTAKVKVDLDVDTGKAQTSRLAARLKGNIQGNLLGSLKSADSGLRGLTRSLSSLPLLARLGIYALIGLLALGPALFGMFNSLGREVLNFGKNALLLPAVFSMLAATVITAKIAFSGMGDAIKAALGHDPKALEDAIKGLTPSARSFVLEIHKALPVIDLMKKRVQEAFFRPLKGEITQLVNAIGPTVSSGLTRISGALGSDLKLLFDVLEKPSTERFLNNLFTTTADVIKTLGPPLAHLVDALIKAANAALPSVKDLGKSFGDFIDKFATWLINAINDGRFQKWLDDGKQALIDIKDVVFAIIGLFGTLFDNANGDGRSFLAVLADIVGDLNDFAKSDPGRRAFEGFAIAAKGVGLILIGLAGMLFSMIAAIGVFISGVKDAINWVGKLLGKKGNLVGGSSGGSLSAGSLGSLAGIGAFASGSIVRQPQLATIAEAGPEVVIPLTRPGRARELADQSGLTRMLRPTGGGNVTQIFYLGEQEITARMVQITDSRIDGAVADAAYGTRAAA